MSKLKTLLKDAGAAGDSPAQRQAWEELTRLLRMYVSAVMTEEDRSVEESMDVVNSIVESFVSEARDGRIRFESEGQLKRYLKGAARNKLHDHARRRTALKRGGRAKSIPIGADSSRGEIDPANPQSADMLVLDREDFIESMRRRLSEFDRSLWSLRLQGADWSEIALAFGVTPDAARKRVERINAALRDAVDRR